MESLAAVLQHSLLTSSLPTPPYRGHLVESFAAWSSSTLFALCSLLPTQLTVHQIPIYTHTVTADTSHCMYNTNLTKFIKRVQICIEMLTLTDVSEVT